MSIDESKTEFKQYGNADSSWTITNLPALEVGDRILYASVHGYIYTGIITRVMKTMVELSNGSRVTKHNRRIVVLK